MLTGAIMIGIKVIPKLIKKSPEMLPVILRLVRLNGLKLDLKDQK